MIGLLSYMKVIFWGEMKIPAMLWKCRARLPRGWIKWILLHNWKEHRRQRWTVCNTMHLRPEPCRNMGCIGQNGDEIDHFISSFLAKEVEDSSYDLSFSRGWSRLWERLLNTNGAWMSNVIWCTKIKWITKAISWECDSHVFYVLKWNTRSGTGHVCGPTRRECMLEAIPSWNSVGTGIKIQ